MWQTLSMENINELKQMKFSRQAIRKFKQLRQTDFKIVTFLQKCLITDYVQLSISFLNVYTTFEDFIKRIQGKRINMCKLISVVKFFMNE